ncbi:MAG: response regulator [Anaerolineales bacterium]
MSTDQGYLLIVEDDPDIRKLLNTTLTFKGFRVITAQNGKEALDIIRAECPRMVIADIMMPQLDGFGLVHRLRIDPETRGVPVVFISATYVSSDDREFALKIGVTRFLQKPVDLERLLKTISELLERDVHTAIPPMDEARFYEGYRKRLEIKLDQKIKQIAREEHLLGLPANADNEDIQISLRHAIYERDELQSLLEQIHIQMEKITRQSNN